MYAFGATAIATAAVSGVGCSDSTTATPDDGRDDAGERQMPMYGAPAVDAQSDAPIQVDAAYGGPPIDAGDGGDGGDGGDAGDGG